MTRLKLATGGCWGSPVDLWDSSMNSPYGELDGLDNEKNWLLILANCLPVSLRNNEGGTSNLKLYG